MFYKVKEVFPLENLKLKIVFEDDTIKIYDVKPLLNRWKVFSDLKTIDKLFEQVRVDVGGYGISWNENLDLSCNELWNSGKAREIEE